MSQGSFDGQAEGMNRRQLLGKGAALLGGALAGTALQAPKALGQEKYAHKGSNSATCARFSVLPNLDPPVVQVAGGKLRGFREGKTTVFLGIP